MKRFLILFPLCALAADLSLRPRLIDADHALTIEHCHPGDRAIIHIEPVPDGSSRSGGWMITPKAKLTLEDMSMTPSGTNRFEIQTICRGMTSAPLVMLVNVRRPPPAPRVQSVLARPWEAPLPPLPAGLTMPLPNPTNYPSYNAYRASTNQRRSQ